MPHPARRSALLDSSLFMLAALLTNGLVFGLHLANPSPSRIGPPGWVVGSIWLILFGLFGAAHGLARRQSLTRLMWGLRGLALFCLGYPFYTLGFKNQPVSLATCLIAALWAAILTLRLRRRSAAAARLMLPSLVWLAYATSLIWRQM